MVAHPKFQLGQRWLSRCGRQTIDIDDLSVRRSQLCGGSDCSSFVLPRNCRRERVPTGAIIAGDVVLLAHPLPRARPHAAVAANVGAEAAVHAEGATGLQEGSGTLRGQLARGQDEDAATRRVQLSPVQRSLRELSLL